MLLQGKKRVCVFFFKAAAALREAESSRHGHSTPLSISGSCALLSSPNRRGAHPPALKPWELAFGGLFGLTIFTGCEAQRKGISEKLLGPSRTLPCSESCRSPSRSGWVGNEKRTTWKQGSKRTSTVQTNKSHFMRSSNCNGESIFSGLPLSYS